MEAGGGGEALVLPDDDLYSTLIADPIRATFALPRLSLGAGTISAAGLARNGVKIGGRLGLVRFRPGGNRDRGLQIGAELGFAGQLDREHESDNLGGSGTADGL